MSCAIKVQPLQQTQQSKPEEVKQICMDFNWSIHPLARWMCCLGVPLPISDYSCWMYYFYRPFCFLLVVLIQFSLVIHIFRNAKNVSREQINGISTTALSWNFIIDNTNFALYAIGGHCFLLTLTRPKIWMDLVHSFEMLEKNFPLRDLFYSKCRQLTVYLTAYIIASVLLFEIIFGLQVIPTSSTLLRKILDISGYFNKFYPATALALFCILARLVTLHLESIRLRIEELVANHRPLSPSAALIEYQYLGLKILRRHYNLVCTLVKKLNDYFGAFLLLQVAFIFIGVINCSMYVLMSAMSIDGLLGAANAIICFDDIIHLFLLTTFSDNIISEVDRVYMALVELTHQQTGDVFRREVDLFTEQLLHLKFSIEAKGFFNVSRKLFPSLIGTTLTYFFILVQFHSAEKP